MEDQSPQFSFFHRVSLHSVGVLSKTENRFPLQLQKQMQVAPIKLGKLNYSSGHSLNWSVGQCLLYLYFKKETQSIYPMPLWKGLFKKKKMFLETKSKK